MTTASRSSRCLVAAPEPLESVSLGRIATVLRESGMPPAEIRAVLSTDEPELVHRYLELHVERLEEWLGSQRRSLAAIEPVIASRREC